MFGDNYDNKLAYKLKMFSIRLGICMTNLEMLSKDMKEFEGV